MSNQVIFLIIVVGMFVGGFIAYRLAGKDFLSLFLGKAMGATPGLSLLVGETTFAAIPLVWGFLLWWRVRSTRKNNASLS